MYERDSFPSGPVARGLSPLARGLFGSGSSSHASASSTCEGFSQLLLLLLLPFLNQ